MKKNIFRILILFCALLFLPCMQINAIDSDIDTEESTVGGVCKKEGCWISVRSNGDSLKGMRVTLMYTDGTDVFGAVNSTRNFVGSAEELKYLKDKTGYYYYSIGKCNKVQYAQGHCSIYKNVKSQKNTLPYSIDNATEFNSFFDEIGISFSSNITSWNLSAIWNSIEEKSKSDKEKVKEIIAQLFFGGNKEILSTFTSEQVNRMWIVVEPFTIVKYQGEYYLGTLHELSSLIYRPYQGVRATPINTVIGRRMPCSAITTGSIIQKNGVSKVDGATATGYFNGILEYVSLNESASTTGKESLSGVCASTSKNTILDSRYIDTFETTIQKGVGIGLLYGPDFLDAGLKCSDVEEAIPELKGITVEKFDTYPDEIPIVTADGKNTTVNKEWYKDECTCFGLYENYQEKTNVYMPKLSKLNIQNIFSANKAFFNALKQNLTAQYKDVPTAGEVTEWTWEKYEALKCKYASADCTTVDFNKIGSNVEDFNYYYYGYCKSSCRVYWFFGSYISSSCRNRCMNTYYYQPMQQANQCKSLLLYPNPGFTDAYIFGTGKRWDPNRYGHESQLNNCFNIYYEQFGGTRWTVNSYLEAGCSLDTVELPVVYNCTPQYNTGDCINGENTYYIDSADGMTEEEYWEYCVFNPNEEEKQYDIPVHKTTANGANTYYDANITKDYCPVYCTETMNAHFDSSTITVKAGQNFVWDNHSVSGSRTCKTKEIDYDAFEADLKAANQAILDDYVDWQSRVLANQQTYSGVGDCCLVSCSHCSEVPNDCPEGETDCGTHIECAHPCDHYGTTYCPSDSVNSFSASASTLLGTLYASDTAPLGCYCNEDGDVPTAPYYSESNNQASLKRNAKSVIETMRACYDQGTLTDWKEYIYNMNPNVTVTYSDGHYNYSDELVASEVYYRPYKTTKKCEADVKDWISSCSGHSCSTTDESMLKCETMEMFRSGTMYFDLKDGIFRFVDKATHTAMHNVLGANRLGTTNNYIDIGYSNFPVAFSTEDGLYGEYHGQGALNLDYYSLGYKIPGSTSFTKTSVDNIMQAISADYTKWKCEFKVDSDLIPNTGTTKCKPGDPKCSEELDSSDIVLIYRPIDLSNPFPDIDSKGRYTGSNWCSYGYICDNDPKYNQNIKNVITNNRGVKGEEIYGQEPMYTFVLTPATIKEIRRYNDNEENSYGSYVGTLDGKVYDFICDKGTARNCKSEYLWHLINTVIPGKSGQAVTGTCSREQTFNTNLNNNKKFEQCRSLNSSFYLN